MLVAWRPGSRAAEPFASIASTRRPGAREKVFVETGWHSVQAKLLAPRPMPDARSSVVRDDDPRAGSTRSTSGSRAPGRALPKGMVKSVRVVEGVPAAADRPVARRLLGEVPIAEDGSYQVQVPANTPVQIGAPRRLRDRRFAPSAWLWVRNHAAQGCVGCNEDPERTPPNRLIEALQAPAPILNPPPADRRILTDAPGGAGGTDAPVGEPDCHPRRPQFVPLPSPSTPEDSHEAPPRPRRRPPASRRVGRARAGPGRQAARLHRRHRDVRHQVQAQLRRPRHEQHRRGHRARARVFDYDGDGFLDIYFVNGRWHPDVSDNRGRDLSGKLKNALYRNNGDGTFTDVTDKAGRGGRQATAFGCSAADYDNDGYLDLYVCNYGPDELYHNNGDGTFTDVTEKAGVGDPRWSLGAVWLDYDGDGDLDLLRRQLPGVRRGQVPLVLRGGGLPRPAELQRPQPDPLYRNNGDGTFTDVTKEAGVYNPAGAA